MTPSTIQHIQLSQKTYGEERLTHYNMFLLQLPYPLPSSLLVSEMYALKENKQYETSMWEITVEKVYYAYCVKAV